jgi:hypothetical protein
MKYVVYRSYDYEIHPSRIYVPTKYLFDNPTEEWDDHIHLFDSLECATIHLKMIDPSGLDQWRICTYEDALIYEMMIQ